MAIPEAARKVIDSGRLAHFVTLNSDGSPQVSCVWGGDGRRRDRHGASFGEYQKVKNVRRNPRVSLSIETDNVNEAGLQEYLVVHGTARMRKAARRSCCRSSRTSTSARTWASSRPATRRCRPATSRASRLSATAASDRGLALMRRTPRDRIRPLPRIRAEAPQDDGARARTCWAASPWARPPKRRWRRRQRRFAPTCASCSAAVRTSDPGAPIHNARRGAHHGGLLARQRLAVPHVRAGPRARYGRRDRDVHAPLPRHARDAGGLGRAQTTESLDAKPAEGRTDRAILLHVLATPGAYVSPLLGGIPGDSRIGTLRSAGRYRWRTACVSRGHRVRSDCARRRSSSAATCVERGQITRTLRKAIRRTLEHDWEHLASFRDGRAGRTGKPSLSIPLANADPQACGA